MNTLEVRDRFKFQCGDVICHKALPTVAFVVASRVVSETPGGVDLMYKIARPNHTDEVGIGVGLSEVYEHEIEPYDDAAQYKDS